MQNIEEIRHRRAPEASASASAVRVTAAALTRARLLLSREERPELGLRVFIQGGGCSGFQYGFSLDHEIPDEDTLIERDGVRLLVDRMSLPYLEGAEIDFTEDLSGSQFVIRNPNAEVTCSCGSSFAPC